MNNFLLKYKFIFYLSNFMGTNTKIFIFYFFIFIDFKFFLQKTIKYFG